MIGTDIGGTFTDIALTDEHTGRVITGKILTTPNDPSRAIFDGLDKIMKENGISFTEVDKFIHGTTLIANTLIERKGVPTGLITTEGFRDVIEIGNEMRYDIFDLFLKKKEPLIPRYLRREIRERIDSTGKVLQPIQLDDIRASANFFIQEGITSIAVALFNSYCNPVNEQEVAKILIEEIPNVTISLSSDVAPEIREYERFSTTVANAYVKPLVRRYISKLKSGLIKRGADVPVNIVLSNGGLTDAKSASEYPIRIIESGPAAGVIAAAFHGGMAGEQNIIAFDMGGTTAKMCLVHNGDPVRVYEFEAARLQRFKKGSGIPLRIPVMEMIEIGAGGGSIAHLDNMGMLKVGPQSAGSEPGPACYNRGGKNPVVTDADLLLGYLDPNYFLGGEMNLDLDSAQKSIQEMVADPLGIGAIEAAAGIHDIVNSNMVSAARIHFAEKGADHREFSLVATGGAGPVHAYGIARVLGLKRIICPPATGVASALGMLVAPPLVELGRSYVSDLKTMNWELLRDIFSEMRQKALSLLSKLRVSENKIQYLMQAEMRYSGQGYEISVTIPEGTLEQESTEQLESSFISTYESTFGHCPQGVSLEIINLRLRAETDAQIKNLHFERYQPNANKALKGKRSVYFSELKNFAEVNVYDRYCLTPGTSLEGPLVIEERESTVIAGPLTRVKIDDHLNIIIDLF